MEPPRKRHAARKIEEELRAEMRRAKNNSERDQQGYDVEQKRKTSKNLLEGDIGAENESTKETKDPFLLFMILVGPDLYEEVEKAKTRTNMLEEELGRTRTRLKTLKERNKIYRSIIKTYEKL